MAGRTVRDVDIDAWRLCIEYAGAVPLGAFNWPLVLGWVLDALEEARAAQLPAALADEEPA